MRLTIITAGSRGDVQPYVALGRALRDGGYDVRVATHETFRDFVGGHGLGFAPVAGDPRAILATAAADAWLATGRRRKTLAVMRELRGMAPQLMEEMLEDYWRAAQGADVVLFSAVGLATVHAAERLGIPRLAAYLQPLTPTRAFPTIGLPPRVRLGPAFNLATHVVAEALLWRAQRREVDRWRVESLGLPRAPRVGPFHTMAAARVPVLYGFSPRVVPRPVDWDASVHVTGYWFLEPPPEWAPPPTLARFLADGPPPVYCGFGSMTPRSAEWMTRVVLEGLERAGCRGVLLRGWGALGAGALPSWATAVEDVPHEWLFPRCAAVVHHGGAGTTAAGLRAGVPNVVVPLGFDQPFWGERVAALGVGPRPIPRRKLTSRRLAAALASALGDAAMRARAAQLGAAIRAEDGTREAVRVVDAAVRDWRGG